MEEKESNEIFKPENKYEVESDDEEISKIIVTGVPSFNVNGGQTPIDIKAKR